MFELKSIFLILATVTLVFCGSEYYGYFDSQQEKKWKGDGKKTNLIEFCNNIFRHFVSSLINVI